MATFRKSAVTRQQKGANVNGNNVDLTKFKGRTGTVIPSRVFVGGICPTASENDLLPLFAKYGTVKAIKIVNDENGQSRGYGFVTYEKADDCLRLLHDHRDGKNLLFNERRLNISQAIMKNPPLTNRYTTESFVVPVTPNLYFTNNLPYQYQEGAAVYPSNPYVPPLTVVPTVSDTAYYPNNYGVPATPYQGAALFYPVPTNASPIMLGHQPYSQYQPAATNNSVYVNSSANSTSSSPPSSTAAKNPSSMTTTGNNSEMHPSHSTPLICATPPNISSLPPPLPYQLTHQPQFYNSSIMPPYTGEVYYNMMHSACYPMMTVNSQETYSMPCYDNESCSVNLITEDNNSESANSYQSNAATIMSSTPETNGCDSSPTSLNSSGGGSNVNPNECKSMPPMGPPPPTATEHIRPEYIADNGTSPTPANSAPTHTVAAVQTQQQHAPSAEYTSNSYAVQHRNGGALIYPNTPIPQPNVYFNSMYVAEVANPSLSQCQYSKNLSDFVSDHLPKRDANKYPPKKYVPPQAKDTPPNIPKFPYFVNNNYPGYVNRNVKDKDFKNMNGAKNGDIKMTPQHQRMVRNLTNGNNTPPKPRVFHNQNQYGGPPRPPKGDRMMSQNGHYPRNGPGGISRQTSYDMSSAPSNPYGYPQTYVPSYAKNTCYEGHRKYGQANNNNNGGYRPKHDRQNGSNESNYTKNLADDRVKKQTSQQDASDPSNNEQTELATTAVTEIEESQQQQQQPQQPAPEQQQQLCAEMQNLTV